MFYSQFNEDKILSEIFHGRTSGFCVEVGANNGIQDSTSLFFENLGWKCLLVEPNPELCSELRKNRKRSVLYECAVTNEDETTLTLFVAEGADRANGVSTVSTQEDCHERIKRLGFVTRPVVVRGMTLNKILTDADIRERIDFISIDVEGHELEALQGFSLEKWRPRILLIEDNSNFADLSVCAFLRSFGYIRFRRTGVNDWYAHQSDKSLVNVRSYLRVLWKKIKAKIRNSQRAVMTLLKSNFPAWQKKGER